MTPDTAERAPLFLPTCDAAEAADRPSWLDLARVGCGDDPADPADLGRAIVRLATLAAATHRARAAEAFAEGGAA